MFSCGGTKVVCPQHCTVHCLCLCSIQLCCTKHGRLYLREKKVYLILRELHKWEEDGGAKEACEKVVQLLIGDEPEQDNLEEIKTHELVETQSSSN